MRIRQGNIRRSVFRGINKTYSFDNGTADSRSFSNAKRVDRKVIDMDFSVSIFRVCTTCKAKAYAVNIAAGGMS